MKVDKFAQWSFAVTLTVFVGFLLIKSIMHNVELDKRPILYNYTDQSIGQTRSASDYKTLFGLEDASRFQSIHLNSFDDRFSIQRYPTFIVLASDRNTVKLVTNSIERINRYSSNRWTLKSAFFGS